MYEFGRTMFQFGKTMFQFGKATNTTMQKYKKFEIAKNPTKSYQMCEEHLEMLTTTKESLQVMPQDVQTLQKGQENHHDIFIKSNVSFFK
jgi:hypothetical protein